MGPTPPVLGYGGLPQTGGAMPQVLDCTLINKVSIGSEWYGLQIGRSTFEDVVDILVPEYIYWDSYYGNLVFDEIPHKITTWWLPVNTCFLGNTLGAIEFYPDDKEYPKYLEDFIEKYGEPDRVTWGYDDFTRTMIWVEEGMMIVVEHLYKGDALGPDTVHDVKLFPPIKLKKLE